MDFVGRLEFGPSQYRPAYNSVTQHLYVGMGASFVVISLAVPAHPALVGWVDPGDFVTGVTYGGSGNTVYAAGGSGKVWKIDVSNPSAPVVAATCDLAGAPVSYSIQLNPGGTQLFVAASWRGLRVVDTATMIETTGYVTTGSATDVFVLGNNAYVAAGATMTILDITTVPPSLAGTFGMGAGSARGVWAAVQGTSTYAYIADSYSGTQPLRIVDVTVPAAPVQVGGLPAYGPPSWSPPPYAYTLSVIGTTAYVGCGGWGLYIVDVSVPASPVVVKSYASQGAQGLAVNGAVVYLSDAYGVRVVDTAPASPTLVGTFLGNTTYGVSVRGNYAYCAGDGGLDVVDISTPQRPTTVARASVGGQGGFTSVALSGNYALVGGPGGLVIWDISNPLLPAYVSWVSTGNYTYSVQVVGTYAYLASNSGGMFIVDVSNPAVPLTVGELATPNAYDVSVAGNYAYIADYSNGLMVADISNPAAPALVGMVTTPGPPLGVAVVGGRAYVAADSVGVLIYDLASPTVPVLVGSYAIQAYRSRVVNYGTGFMAYVGGPSGMEVLDVSAPATPVLMGSFAPGLAFYQDITLADGYAYLANGPLGADILRFEDSCDGTFEPNDSFDLAYPLAFDTIYNATICPAGDNDYYALTLPSGGTVSATLEPPSGENYDLFLFDPQQKLLAYSMQAGSTTESVTKTVSAAGSYYLLVNGSDFTQFSSTQTYRLVASFTPCAGPVQPLLIYTGQKDINNDAILDILDPNQPSTLTGYDIYRSTLPTGPWTLIAGNVVDEDQGTPNVQYVDQGSNGGPIFFYQVKAVNATCGAEGP